MIINGASNRCGRWWAFHLTNEVKNDRVELCEIRGLLATGVAEAFREMEAIAVGARASNYFYQANLNPRENERLTPEQWEEAADLLEQNLGLDGQPRFVIEHEKNGRIHRHVVWFRIDIYSMKAISDSLTARIHEQTSRELEELFGLEHTDSVLVKDRDKDRKRTRTPEDWAMLRAQDGGIDARIVTAEVTELWQSADSGKAFAAALAEHGYILAKGDRRDFVIIDPAGDDHSLARRIDGGRAAQVRTRMSDVERDSLPSVAEAKALWREAVERWERGVRKGEPEPTIEPEPVPILEETPANPVEAAAQVDDPDAARADRQTAFDAHLRPAIESVEQTGSTSGDSPGWWGSIRAALEHYRDALIEAVRYMRDAWHRWLDPDNDRGPDHSR